MFPKSSDIIPSTALDIVSFQVSDIGHSYLPWEIHMKWCQALEVEFFKQGAMELQQSRHISPLMDPTKPGVTAPVNSVAFFNVVSLPLIQAWAPVFHRSGHQLLNQAWQNLHGWQESLAKENGHADGKMADRPRKKSDRRKSTDMMRGARASLDFGLRPFGGGDNKSNKVLPAWQAPSANGNANAASTRKLTVHEVPSAEPMNSAKPLFTRTTNPSSLPCVAEHTPAKAEAVLQATSFY